MTSEIGLAEALAHSLLLKLNANELFPECETGDDWSRISFRGWIVRCGVVIKEDFEIFFDLLRHENDSCGWYSDSRTVAVSKPSCIFNPLFDPESVFDKIIKVLLFIKSLGDHMANVDMDWLIYGIKNIIDGSKTIITKKPVYFKRHVLCEIPELEGE